MSFCTLLHKIESKNMCIFILLYSCPEILRFLEIGNMFWNTSLQFWFNNNNFIVYIDIQTTSVLIIFEYKWHAVHIIPIAVFIYIKPRAMVIMAVNANVNSSIVLVYVLYSVISYSLISNALYRINTKCVPSKCI